LTEAQEFPNLGPELTEDRNMNMNKGNPQVGMDLRLSSVRAVYLLGRLFRPTPTSAESRKDFPALNLNGSTSFFILP
jgi:hypothetical protein